MKIRMLALVLSTFASSVVFGAETRISFSGDVTLRFMDDKTTISTMSGSADSVVTNAAYFNYLWNLRMRFVKSKTLSFGFRLSNPGGAAGERVASNSTTISTSNYRPLSLPEAFFKWNYEAFTLCGGLVPIKPTTLYNLLIYEGYNYVEVGQAPMSVMMNNSQQGFLAEMLAYDIKEETSIAAQLLVATAVDDRLDSNTLALDNLLKRDQYRFVLQIPCEFIKKTVDVTPGFNFRTNVGRSADGEKSASLFSSGINVGYKPFEALQIFSGYAFGSFDKRDLNLADSVAPLSHLVELEATYETALGSAQILGTYSNWKNRAINAPSTGKPILYNQFFGDLSFGFMFNDLIIKPRLRLWWSGNNTNDVTKFQIRPELQVRANFK